MKRRRERLAAAVELTPLIDIVFLLLIFFMVSTTFIRHNAVAVDLPQGDGAALAGGDAAVEITVHRDGRYQVHGQLLAAGDPGALVGALQALAPPRAAAADGAAQALIFADGRATHQAVVQAMDAARRAGLVHISIITRPPSDVPALEGADG